MSKILIITRQKANQRLLADYLGRHHDIIVAPPAKAETKRLLQSETFDLGIVDGPALNQYASALETRKSAEAPLFLPVLLITPRQDVRLVTCHLWRAVDDLIISPIEKVELQARVEILLRARHLSLELEKRNRESLQTSEARYRHIFEGAAVSIWEEDLSRVQESLDKLKAKGVDNIEQYLQNHPDFVRQCAAQVRLLDVNQASLKMFEANSKEDLLISLAKTFSPETLETFTNALTAFARHENRFEAETVFQTLRGRPINVLLSIAFPPPGSPFTVTLVSMMDITARKQAEEELRKYREHLEELVKVRTEELQSSNKELEAFAYSVSHDLRAPLRAIDGFTRILMEDYVEKLDDEGKRLGDIIQKNAQKMGNLIDDLLAFSRLGRAAMQFSRIDMKNMVIAIYHELTSSSERERIEFSVGDLPDAYGDTNMLRQVWMNLIANAIKFSSKREKAVISITGMQDDEKTTYSISDNGVGFDMKYVNKIFDVFQRLHGEKEYPGTGVGLSLVKRIIHRHNGKVWAESKVDKGATFYFTLPKKGINETNKL